MESAFDDIYNSTVDFMDAKNFMNVEAKYETGEINKEQVDEIKKFIKEEFNRDIDDFRLLDFISQTLPECCQEDANYNLNLDVEGIKTELKAEGFFDKKIQEYADNIPEYAGGPYLAMSEIIKDANDIESKSIDGPEKNEEAKKQKPELKEFGY